MIISTPACGQLMPHARRLRCFGGPLARPEARFDEDWREPLMLARRAGTRRAGPTARWIVAPTLILHPPCVLQRYNVTISLTKGEIGNGGDILTVFTIENGNGGQFGSGGLSLRCHSMRQSLQWEAHCNPIALCEVGSRID